MISVPRREEKVPRRRTELRKRAQNTFAIADKVPLHVSAVHIEVEIVYFLELRPSFIQLFIEGTRGVVV